MYNKLNLLQPAQWPSVSLWTMVFLSHIFKQTLNLYLPYKMQCKVSPKLWLLISLNLRRGHFWEQKVGHGGSLAIRPWSLLTFRLGGFCGAGPERDLSCSGQLNNQRCSSTAARAMTMWPLEWFSSLIFGWVTSQSSRAEHVFHEHE